MLTRAEALRNELRQINLRLNYVDLAGTLESRPTYIPMFLPGMIGGWSSPGKGNSSSRCIGWGLTTASESKRGERCNGTQSTRTSRLPNLALTPNQLISRRHVVTGPGAGEERLEYSYTYIE